MKKEILIVEYSPETIDSLKDMLFQDIFEITVAGDAEVARALLKKKKFDLVIIEALLPKSHGFDLSSFICQNYPDTRVIIISDKLTKLDYKKEALQHGACDFFEKPICREKFTPRVLKHLGLNTGIALPLYPGETTKIDVLSYLKEMLPAQQPENKTDSQSFDDIIKNIKKETDAYKIDLD